jgi:hypothetical protein
MPKKQILISWKYVFSFEFAKSIFIKHFKIKEGDWSVLF